MFESFYPPALILLAGGLVLPLLPKKLRSAAFLLFPAFAVWYLYFVLRPAYEGGIVKLAWPWLGYELIPLQVTRLGLVFGYIFAIMTFVGGVYAYHLDDVSQQSMALVYASGSLGVCFAGDLITLLVFWELMMASVWLVWARRTPDSDRAGNRYLITHVAGGGLLLGGIVLLIAQYGTIDLARLTVALSHDGQVAALAQSPGAWLALAGVALNAALPPLGGWLPDAYPQGTITGSVFLSSFTTKTAVYVLIKLFAGWEILAVGGVFMALYGVVYAVLENDIRRLLAYHIISQVGYMVAGAGLGSPDSLNGATAHAFCHILYKSLLFMGAGAVLYATGKSKLTELGGIWRGMKLAGALYMIGAFSISGFPLFNGFVSKSMVTWAALNEHREWIYLLLTLASVGTWLHTGLKLPWFTWCGTNKGATVVRSLPWNMLAGMALGAALCTITGIAPGLLYRHLPYATHYEPYTAHHVIEMAQILALTAVGFFLLLKKLEGEATISFDTDWLYRRPAKLARRIFVEAVDDGYAWAGAKLLAAARWSGIVGRDAVGYFTGRYSEPYNPDAARMPAGLAAAIAIAMFSAIALWVHYLAK